MLIRDLRFLSLALLNFAVGIAVAEEKPLRGSGPELERDLPTGFSRLQIGDPAPDFRLMGVDDRYYSLADFAESRYLLVAFLSNHCPYSHAAETRMIPWINRMREHGLGVVAIQPNHPDALKVEELGFSKYNDSFEEMKLYAKENDFTFPYLDDGPTQEVTKRFGALATPDLFLFDEERRLRYSGRFDDSRFAEAETVMRHDAIEAFEDLRLGREIRRPETRPMGCAVKWLETKASRAQASNSRVDWDHEPITIETIDVAGVADLMENRTDKLRLINLWATWCAPCVEEFPDLVLFSRRLKSRPFEVITISMDHPRDEAKALAFLKKMRAGTGKWRLKSVQAEGRATNNYIFSEATTDGLRAALDPDWAGPIPHSVLIAPGGEVVWKQNGRFDNEELTEVIFDHLGGFYQQ